MSEKYNFTAIEKNGRGTGMNTILSERVLTIQSQNFMLW